jgi:hypothetical protein
MEQKRATVRIFAEQTLGLSQKNIIKHGMYVGLLYKGFMRSANKKWSFTGVTLNAKNVSVAFRKTIERLAFQESHLSPTEMSHFRERFMLRFLLVYVRMKYRDSGLIITNKWSSYYICRKNTLIFNKIQ